MLSYFLNLGTKIRDPVFRIVERRRNIFPAPNVFLRLLKNLLKIRRRRKPGGKLYAPVARNLLIKRRGKRGKREAETGGNLLNRC
ncbi:MAG: hypothetical protein AAB869_03065, partial [Patescibacteria group bacterium]